MSTVDPARRPSTSRSGFGTTIRPTESMVASIGKRLPNSYQYRPPRLHRARQRAGRRDAPDRRVAAGTAVLILTLLEGADSVFAAMHAGARGSGRARVTAD